MPLSRRRVAYKLKSGGQGHRKDLMTKPRYQHIITLNEKDEKKLLEARKTRKLIDIFRDGLYSKKD